MSSCTERLAEDGSPSEIVQIQLYVRADLIRTDQTAAVSLSLRTGTALSNHWTPLFVSMPPIMPWHRLVVVSGASDAYGI